MIHLVALSCIFFFPKAKGAYMGGYLLTPLVIEQLAPSPDHTAHLPHQKVMQCHWIKKNFHFLTNAENTAVEVRQLSLAGKIVWLRFQFGKIILPYFPPHFERSVTPGLSITHPHFLSHHFNHFKFHCCRC